MDSDPSLVLFQLKPEGHVKLRGVEVVSASVSCKVEEYG